MKSVFRSFGIIATVVVIGFFMTGCASSASQVSHGWNRMLTLPDHEDIRDYTILGVAQVQERRTVILGGFLPTPPPLPVVGAGGAMIEFGNVGLYLFRTTRGQATYAALLAEAKRQFPNANAVIGVQVDRVDSRFFIFTASRTYTLTGLAVEFATAPPPRREQIASRD